MRLITALFFSLFAVTGFSQQDTISATIKHRKAGSDYILYEQKIGVVLDGKLTFTVSVVHDYFISILDKAPGNKVPLKLWDKKGRLFAVGLWNESGFNGTVTYYDAKGRVKSTAFFEKEIDYPPTTP